MTGTFEKVEEYRQCGINIDAQNIGARDHHILDTNFPKGENVIEHLALACRKARPVGIVFSQSIGQIIAEIGC